MGPKWIFLPLFALFCCFSWRYYDRFGRGSLRITVFDVGQGDSILLEFPQGKTLLVDAGGGNEKWNWGIKELFGELTRKSILTLDAALMSHPDRDHSLGFRGLFSGLHVKEFWLNASFLKDGPAIVKELGLAAELAGGTVVPVSERRNLNWNEVQLELIPLMVDKTANNRSLILKVSFNRCTALFVGDIEKQAEHALGPLIGKTTVLKVAHHGSHSSSTEEFINLLQPQIALISDGRKNQYGHPHREVVERYWRRGIQILRTDFHGFVELTVTPNNEIICKSAKGDCGTFLCR